MIKIADCTYPAKAERQILSTAIAEIYSTLIEELTHEEAVAVILDISTEFISNARNTPITSRLLSSNANLSIAYDLIPVSFDLLDWQKFKPLILGQIYELLLQKTDKGKGGIFYTPEHIVNRLVTATLSASGIWGQSETIYGFVPDYIEAIRSDYTIEKPLEEFKVGIQKIKSAEWLIEFCKSVSTITVLDPACGCGNFLYAAYHWLTKLERAAIDRIVELGKNPPVPKVSIFQLYGIDNDPVACELCKRVLLIAEKEIGTSKT